MKTTWKRQYAALLLLFCLILNGAILTFGVLHYDRAYAAKKDELRACGELAATTVLSFQSIGTFATEWSIHGILIAQGETWYDVRNTLGTDLGSGTWEPPVDSLSRSEKRDVILPGELQGRDCLCYAVYSVESSHGTYYLISDLTVLQKEQIYLTLAACGVGLVFSILFAAVLARAMKKVAALSPAEASATAEVESPSSPFANAPEQDLGAHCRALVERFDEAAEERGVILSGSAAPHCTVHCEEGKLKALTEALLAYAITTTPREGRVSLLVTGQKGAVSLRIDHGGIPQDTALMRLSLLATETGATLTPAESAVTVRWEEAVS